MCEKRIRKIKRGSHIARLREVRRIQRLRWLASPTPAEEAPPPPVPVLVVPAPVVRAPVPAPARAPVPVPQATMDKATQKRVILELAWKTIGLMHKNRIIQQKIIALQKETSDFVASVMRNPENRRRYLINVRLYAAGLISIPGLETLRNVPVKIEPQD